MLGAHNATAFASRVDNAEAARRLEAMPNADVRRKRERVFERGYGDEELAEARRSWGEWRRSSRDSSRRAVLLGTGYSLADIKWYSMVPGMPRPSSAIPRRPRQSPLARSDGRSPGDRKTRTV